MKDPDFELKLEVRDYECDLQGIVNNSVYQNYLEHTRHKYISSLNIDFAELSKNGVNLVVKKVEIEYLAPLVSGNCFVSKLKMVRISPLRFGFEQNIYRLSDNKQMIRAFVTSTAINERGRPMLPRELEEIWS